MEKLEIEVFSKETNKGIVRMPGRSFPGLVIQGDTMSTLADHAEYIYEKCRNSDDEDLLWETKNLMETLNGLLLHYEIVLGEHDIPLPYSRKPFNIP
jgi:hypothetical protein